MLKETKLALRVTTSAYDAEIASLIEAGARDLELAGITLDGTVTFEVDEMGGVWQVDDDSTLTDPLAMRAIITYVRMHFGKPDDYDRLSASYDMQKAQLQTATGYGIEDDTDE